MRRTPLNKYSTVEYRVTGWRLDGNGTKVVKKTKSLATADDWANLDSGYWIEKYKDGEYIDNVACDNNYEYEEDEEVGYSADVNIY
jgi:hypothetical protein